MFKYAERIGSIQTRYVTSGSFSVVEYLILALFARPDALIMTYLRVLA